MEGLDGVLITLDSTNVASVKLTHPNHHFIWPNNVLTGSIKIFLDAWIPFNSIPIREEDRHYTTLLHRGACIATREPLKATCPAETDTIADLRIY